MKKIIWLYLSSFEINEDAIREHLVFEDQGYFEPTTEWDSERSWDRLWS